MAYISFQPHDHFNTVIYTGNETARTITVGFQPDWVWTKCRSSAHSHISTDSVTGAGKRLKPDSNNAQDTSGASVASETGVSWNWKANGSGSSNTDGSITSTVSANTTSGFSIVTWTGNSGSIGHGLGVKPSMIIAKPTAATGGWYVTHKNLSAEMQDNYMFLNTTSANTTNNDIWGGEPTTSTFSVGSGLINNTTHIAYVFAEKTGFSKIGSYTGNGNADGAFVYTGFKPNWVLIKRTGSTAQWQMRDGQRGFNGAIKTLYSDSSEVETSGDTFDILSNGFKSRNTSNVQNASGETYIYMAFAEEPLVASNGDIATAR